MTDEDKRLLFCVVFFSILTSVATFDLTAQHFCKRECNAKGGLYLDNECWIDAKKVGLP